MSVLHSVLLAQSDRHTHDPLNIAVDDDLPWNERSGAASHNGRMISHPDLELVNSSFQPKKTLQKKGRFYL